MAITSDPIGPLMAKLTAPMILALLSMVLLGVTDAFFIAQLGTQKLAAISFCLPITHIGSSIALGMGMAISSINSRLIGSGKSQDAARLITDGGILTILVALVIALIGALTLVPLFTLLGADQTVLPDIRSYMIPWLIGAPMLMLTITSGSALRSIGDTKSSAYVTASLSLVNLALDPLLIFGLGPFPELGIQGAAIATVIASLVSLSIGVGILGGREHLIQFNRPKLAHLWPNWQSLLKIAVPAVGANLMTPIAAAIMTAMIASQGAEAVAGFGVGSRIEFMSLLLVFALSSTLPMFIGQNVGAGKNHRAYHALMGCLGFSLVFQTLVYLLLLVSAPAIASLFSTDPEVIRVIKLFLSILPLTYGAHAIVILVMVSLNVLNKPRVALLTTVVRLAVLYVPLAYLGLLLAGTFGLFVGAACGNVLAALFAYKTIRRVCKEQDIAPAHPN